MINKEQHKDLVILGSGPRGLSTALVGLIEGFNITLIDPHPLSSWTPPNILPNIEMRSPITFDLVTFLPDLYKYSLAKYSESKEDIVITQRGVEANTTPVYRKDFLSYLEYIYNIIRPNIEVIEESIIDISPEGVRLSSDSIVKGDNYVIAMGQGDKNKYPNWIKKTELIDKVVNISSINNINNSFVCVVGSGQGAAEIVNHLADNNKVIWCLKKDPIIYRYPSPDYKLWGARTALGSYYFNIVDQNKKIKYLESIKAWQPSITPYINNLLKEKDNNIEKRFPTYTHELNDIFSSVDAIVMATGFDIDVSHIPIEIERCPFIPTQPLLKKGFNSSSISNIYFTGALAMGLDGPRQMSLISSGLTAQSIIDNIKNKV